MFDESWILCEIHRVSLIQKDTALEQAIQGSGGVPIAGGILRDSGYGSKGHIHSILYMFTEWLGLEGTLKPS